MKTAFTRALTGMALVLLLGVCLGGERGLPAREGISNFGKVNDRLYRGAQPGAEGLKNLKRLGVKTILDLRQADKGPKLEAEQAKALGIVHTNIPMSGIRRPKDAQIAAALLVLEKLPAPVFVHCEFGCDRTGTLVACYRIKHDQWSGEVALREARLHGMSKLERGMKRYVEGFAKALEQPSGAKQPAGKEPEAAKLEANN